MSKPKYDSTVARIAGNLAAGLASLNIHHKDEIVSRSVRMARAIIEEVKRTDLKEPE